MNLETVVEDSELRDFHAWRRARRAELEAQQFRYVIFGRPLTWKRDNHIRGRYITDEDTRAGKLAHHLAGRSARGRQVWSLDGAFSVDAIGYWPDAVVGDADRLATLVLDGLEGVAYRTDRQVRDQRGRVFTDYEGPSRVEVRVVRLSVDPVQPKPRKAKGKS